MKVLVVGGSGKVGTLVSPTLKEKHQLYIYDLTPPQDSSLNYIHGDVTDYEGLAKAMQGMDALLYMAMGSIDWASVKGKNSAFDTSTKGLYFALETAANAGISQAVYTSSLSVYKRLHERYFSDEGISPDETDLYGFTKFLGEEICQNATRAWGMNVNALRLCHPTERGLWLEQARKDTPTINTAAEDVGRAILGALAYQGGYQAFMISGDYEQKLMNMSKARRLLGWQPLARPLK